MDVRESYESVVGAIKTWEGHVVIQTTGRSGEKSIAKGMFAWDAVSDNRYCRIGYPSTATSLDTGRVKDVILDREVLITNGARTAVWHDRGRKSVEGFSLPIDITTRPFSVAEREKINPNSLPGPDLEFCPEYMLRGNMPPLVGLFGWLANLQGDDRKRVAFNKRSPTDLEVQVWGAPNSRLRMQKVDGKWLPQSHESDNLLMSWEWNHVSGVLVPTRLTVVDQGIARIYTIDNATINRGIPERGFDADAMAFSKGDHLADRIENRLYIYNGTQFVCAVRAGAEQKNGLQPN